MGSSHTNLSFHSLLSTISDFWSLDLYYVILGCDETSSLTSFSWCNSRGVNSSHHCHYIMASADSKFDDLSDADIDSLIDDAIPKNAKRATAWEISVLKGKVILILNFSFKLVEVYLRVVNRFQYSVCLCRVLNLDNKNVYALIARELLGFTCTHSQIMNSKFSIPHSVKPRLLLVNSCR